MVAGRVLVIDDDQPLCRLICRSLERRGIPAAPFSSIAEARAQEQPPARLVVDLSAISDAAQDELDWLREHRPVVMTGASAAHGRELAGRIAASAYLEKPVEIGELIEALG